MERSKFAPPDPIPPHDCAPPDGGRVWCGVCFKKLPGVDLNGVGFAFPWGGGGKAGRANFHGPTIKERQEKQFADAKKAGLAHPEPSGNRWV